MSVVYAEGKEAAVAASVERSPQALESLLAGCVPYLPIKECRRGFNKTENKLGLSNFSIIYPFKFLILLLISF